MRNRFQLDDFDQDENILNQPPQRNPQYPARHSIRDDGYDDGYRNPRRAYGDENPPRHPARKDRYDDEPMPYDDRYTDRFRPQKGTYGYSSRPNAAYGAPKAGISAWVYFLIIFLFGGAAAFTYYYIDSPAKKTGRSSVPRPESTPIALPTSSTGGGSIPLSTLIPLPTNSIGGVIPTRQPNAPSGLIPAPPWGSSAGTSSGSSGTSGGISSGTSSVDVGTTINVNEVTETHESYEGLTAVQIDNRWGFINQNNVVVIAPIYETVTNFIDNIAVAKIDGRTVIINQVGEIIEQAPDQIVCAIFEIISASLDYKIINMTQVNQYWSFFDSILVAIQTGNWDFITEDQFMSLIEWILNLAVQLIILGWNIGLEIIRQIEGLS